MRGARRKATSYPDRPRRRVERRRLKERAQPGSRWPPQLPQAQRRNHAILAPERHRVGDGGNRGHLQKAGQCLFARTHQVAPFQQRLRQLHRNRRAAEEFFRIAAGGLVRIENRQRPRHRLARLQ